MADSEAMQAAMAEGSFTFDELVIRYKREELDGFKQLFTVWTLLAKLFVYRRNLTTEQLMEHVRHHTTERGSDDAPPDLMQLFLQKYP